MSNSSIDLTDREREELQQRTRSRRGRADAARIARVLLLLEQGTSYTQIQQQVACSAPFISKWKKRFLKERLAGLYSHKGRVAKVLTPKMEAKILAWTQKEPTDGRSPRRAAHSAFSELPSSRMPRILAPPGVSHAQQRRWCFLTFAARFHIAGVTIRRSWFLDRASP